MNNFIISGQGFYNGFEIDEKYKKVHLWVSDLRDAKKFKGDTARKIIDKINIECFLWNPYKEEPLRNKWIIFKDDSNVISKYIPKKAFMKSKTDVKYLNDEVFDYYDYDKCLKLCNDMNNQSYIIIEQTIKKLRKELNDNINYEDSFLDISKEDVDKVKKINDDIKKWINGLFNQCKIVNGYEYTNYEFNKEVIFQKDETNNIFWVKYDNYWKKLEDDYNLYYIEIKKILEYIISEILEEEYKVLLSLRLNK